VVADEQRGAALTLERRHAVMSDRHRRAVAHDVADLQERDVVEPLGQREDLVAVLVGDAGRGALATVTRAALGSRAPAVPERWRRRTGEATTG
jgi:hypothetical protein